jgi:hypothetical protein
MSGLVHTVDSNYLDQYPKYYPRSLISCTTFRLAPCINSV